MPDRASRFANFHCVTVNVNGSGELFANSEYRFSKFRTTRTDKSVETDDFTGVYIQINSIKHVAIGYLMGPKHQRVAWLVQIPVRFNINGPAYHGRHQ